MKERYPRTSDCLRDHFLIATPALNEGFFARSVTYICEHGESGAMGVVINHPLEVELPEILEHLELEVTSTPKDPLVLAGGPVQIDHGFVLHRGPTGWESSMRVGRDVLLTTSRDVLAAIARGEGPKDYLVALGYAGWDAGQLEEELTQNSWLTVPADNDILFNTPVERRLAAAGQKIGIDIDLMSGEAGHA
ncbi:MAG: YqgE/AlgH family protein [Halieaceae bacterium]|jgi:putative transcriptional regulator|nr:YqgE/AlgH family protein [Halieaceae bacterium]